MDLTCVDLAHGAAEIGVMPVSLVTVDFDVHPRSQGTQNGSVRANPDVLLRPVNSMETDYAISLGLENSGKLRR